MRQGRKTSHRDRGLRARFDEAMNIQWARRARRAAAHVILCVVGLKNALQSGAYRQARGGLPIDSGIMSILGTGIITPAPPYLHRLQSAYKRTQLTEEVATVFNTLTGLAGYPGLKNDGRPFDMHSVLSSASSASAITPARETGAHRRQN